jgi:hypothetical protein
MVTLLYSRQCGSMHHTRTVRACLLYSSTASWSSVLHRVTIRECSVLNIVKTSSVSARAALKQLVSMPFIDNTTYTTEVPLPLFSHIRARKAHPTIVDRIIHCRLVPHELLAVSTRVKKRMFQPCVDFELIGVLEVDHMRCYRPFSLALLGGRLNCEHALRRTS